MEPPAIEEFQGSSSWSSAETSQGPDEVYNPRLSLLDECMAMVKFAASNGEAVPRGVLETIDQAWRARRRGASGPDLAEIGECHAKLVKVVAPANPLTILLLANEEAAGFVRHFGATQYARRIWAFALAVFVLFFGVLTYSIREPDNEFLQLGLTTTASLVGAIFYVLFTANRQLRAATFDRRQEGFLTALVVLGALAGTALAYLVVQPGSDGGEDGTQVILTRPLLGLLGGFAVEAVYRILQRLVTTLESLVGGSVDDLVTAQRREADARAARESVELRIELAGRLVELRGRLSSLPDDERDAIQAEIDRLLTTAPGTP